MSDPENAQQERATGAFALVVDSVPADEAAWKALRRALRFSRADNEWLKRNVPGEVRRGAKGDLTLLADAVHEAGFEARVVVRANEGGLKQDGV